jgi:Putative auto-transporter adhesin, head GIN domain
MKSLLLLFTTVILSVVSFAQQINDANAEVREAKNYRGIAVSNAFDVYLSQGNEEAVAVSAVSIKERENITVVVKDGILHIGLNKGKWNGGNKRLKAYISFKEIERLDVSGACNVYMSGTLKANILSINQSGASDLKIKLQVNKLSIDLSGASDMVVTGSALQLSIEASGASKCKAFDLATDICNARASGASDIRITVNKELSAEASGASDVKYKGEGVIRDIKSSGSSKVSRG